MDEAVDRGLSSGGEGGLGQIQPVPAGAMYCRGCSYDLVGSDGSVCPECGRGFDRFDASTWDAVPRNRQLRTRLKRLGIGALIAGLVVMGMYHSVLPRPLSRAQPLVWVWMGMSFGREVRFSRSGDRMRVDWWADECRGIDLIGAGGDVVASLRRGGDDDEWRLRVTRAGVRLEDVLTAVNFYTESDEYLGIGLNPRAMATGSAGGFSVEGTRAELLSEVLRAYRTVPIRSYRLDGAGGLVWVWDEAGRELVRVPAVEAVEGGHEVQDGFRASFPDARSPSERAGW